MSKKFRLALIIVLSILLIGVLTYLYFSLQEKDGLYNFQYGKVVETINGDIKKIEVPDIGLSFEIPNDWKVQKEMEYLLLTNTDFESIQKLEEEENYFDQAWFELVIMSNYTKDFDDVWGHYDGDYNSYVKEIINEIKNDAIEKDITKEGYYLISIDGKEGLRETQENISDNNESYFESVDINIPVDKRMYTFNTLYFSGMPNPKNILDEFINSVKINR